MKLLLIYFKSSRTGANTSTTSAGPWVQRAEQVFLELFSSGLKMSSRG
jgi:hypothetical protein